MAEPDTLRVITWNIMSPDVARVERLDEAASTLAAQQPDVVCLQEAWPGAGHALAEKLNMRMAVYTPSTFNGGSAVLTTLPTAPGVSPEMLELPGWGTHGERSMAAAVTLQSPSGRKWRIVSTHLTWGGTTEAVRLEQAQYLDDLAQAAHERAPATVNVLCGDFNTLPDSRTLRYLTGLDVDSRGQGTLWVDAWSTRGTGPGFTSDPSLARARYTAESVGITRHELIPQRRIDYVLVRGFAHGRPGSPLSCEVVNGGTASDHHAVSALLWDPHVEGA